MNRSLRNVLLLMTGVALFSSCYPDQPDNIDEYDIVYTNYSPTYDFKAFNTFAVPDSVVIITGDLAEGEQPAKVSPEFGDQIVGRIRQNMDRLGWTEVAPTENPDVLVLPSAVKTLNVDAYYYGGGYWGWYYPYYGYGWYYPGYYPTYTSYTTGSLILTMIAPDDLSPTENQPVLWVGVLNGLLEGSDASIITRMTTNIDQAFKQSEYLQQ
ncbi:MAG: DUF4136 domain-containing protein [Flavobacteriales bacterium]|jgi:hypothetical protein